MTTIDQNPRPTTRVSDLRWMVRQAVEAATSTSATLRAILMPTPVNPEKELAKTLRGEAARRAADKLLR